MATTQDLQKINAQNFEQNPTTSNQMIVPSVQVVPPPVRSRDDVGKGNLAREIASDTNFEHQNKSIANPFASDYFNTKMFGIDLGSVTDKPTDIYGGVNPYSKAVDWENLRRNEQSNVSAGINLFSQFVGKTAVNTIGGILGGFYGIGSAIANGEGSKIYDNEFNRGLDGVTEAIERGNSVFTSQRARDNAPLGLFSFETIKDVNDAFSFVSGAILAEVATAGAASAGIASAFGRVASKAGIAAKTAERITGSVGLGNRVKKAGNFITRSEELSKLLSSVDPNDVQKLQTIARDLGTTVDDLARYRKGLDNFNSTFQKGRGVVTGTFWEAGLEARHTKDELIANETDKLNSFIENKKWNSEEEKEAYRESQMKKITDVGNTAGIATFGLNTAILGASNYIQFPTIFGQKSPITSVNSMRDKLTRKGLNDYIKSGGKATDIARTLDEH